ncbi:Magnesium transporter NIPA [Plantibacter sp. VKM Ac-1784]|uniref:Magnesium transporter NIPA n=1 Tax=Plantibacter elymi (nom. nud.) TaxID=199708 RepID=A0ABY1RG49_9MICO|nr:DMT family transporter [Plantibacter sp. VKM Ac-1784]SMQ73243.1 Magnesium transporter NIPA [Plantibacter sp. VKM Ac-1784]
MAATSFPVLAAGALLLSGTAGVVAQSARTAVDLDIPTISVTPYQAIGIPIALVGAFFLAVGTQLQSRGVGKVEAASSAFGLKQLPQLLGRPSWLIGTLLLGLAIVFQLVALAFAPLIVVQPLGAIALVITALLNARVTRVKITKEQTRAMVLCVAGIGLFVIVAALYAVEEPIRQPQLIIILIMLTVVTLALAGAYALWRRKLHTVFYVVAAGVLYGFVVTLAKVVINRVITQNFEGLTVVGIIALLVAAGVGGFFVQKAHQSGQPDLVVAGLTVVDPLVAVGIGIVVLGEAASAPWFALVLFVVAGAIAVFGVWKLAMRPVPAPGEKPKKPRVI